MFSLLISLLVSIAVGAACSFGGVSKGTSIFFAVVALLAANYLVGFLVRKKVKVVQEGLQALMTREQQRINRKVKQFQSKPGANIKMIQRQIENDQKAIFNQGLEYIEKFEPFKKWSPLMGRQIATMRFQFHYQLKEFEQADEIMAQRGLFKGPLMMEPMMIAMKMARQYKNKDIEGLEKTFKRRVRWTRGSRATLLYGVMTWAQVKEGKIEEARALLTKAKDATGNETFAQNWAKLANDNFKSYSNAGLGEEWFGLYLENPPTPKQKKVREKSGRGRMF